MDDGRVRGWVLTLPDGKTAAPTADTSKYTRRLKCAANETGRHVQWRGCGSVVHRGRRFEPATWRCAHTIRQWPVLACAARPGEVLLGPVTQQMCTAAWGLRARGLQPPSRPIPQRPANRSSRPIRYAKRT